MSGHERGVLARFARTINSVESISSVTGNDRLQRGRQAQTSSRRRRVHQVSAPSL